MKLEFNELYVSKDEDNRIFFYTEKPNIVRDSTCWVSTSSGRYLYTQTGSILSMLIQSNSYDCIMNFDWKNSLHKVNVDGSLDHIPQKVNVFIELDSYEVDQETKEKILKLIKE